MEREGRLEAYRLTSLYIDPELYYRNVLSLSGVGSGVAPGARALPCWIVLESFHKRETCFAGRIFRAWSGRPSLAVTEPPRGIEKAWLREALAERAFGRRMRLELCCHERHS